MKKKILLQWLLGLLFLVLVFCMSDVKSLLSLPRIRWSYVAFVAAGTAAFALAHNQRWLDIVRAVAHEKGRRPGEFLNFFRWLMNSYVVGMVVPTDLSLAGLRVFYMSRSKVLAPEVGLFSVLLDRAFDLLVFALFAFTSVLYFGHLLKGQEAMILLGILLAMVLALFVGLGGRSITLILKAYRWAFGLFRYFPFLKERLGGGGASPETVADFRRPAIARIVLLSVAKYACMVLRFYFLGQAFGTGLSLFHAFLVVPMVQAAFMVSITPGGLGVVELGTYGALRLAGVEEAHILLFVVGQRVIVSSTVLGTALVAHAAGLLWSRKGQGAYG